MRTKELDIMSFIEKNNINDYSYFSNNYDAIVSIYIICKLFGDYNIKNLFIDSNNIHFELDKQKKNTIPIINSSSMYNRYNVHYESIENNMVAVNLNK